ncbi:MAG: hypothetical protein NTX24_01085 [Candidatus Pacearchaeota archaeon]|nr:hypothetical protein [Candidatus Pacearchaeota archaeon]
MYSPLSMQRHQTAVPIAPLTETWYVVCQHAFARSVTAARIITDFFQRYERIYGVDFGIRIYAAGLFDGNGSDIGPGSRLATHFFNFTGLSKPYLLTQEKADAATRLFSMTQDISDRLITGFNQPREKITCLDLPHAGLAFVLPGTPFLVGTLEQKLLPNLSDYAFQRIEAAKKQREDSLVVRV